MLFNTFLYLICDAHPYGRGFITFAKRACDIAVALPPPSTKAVVVSAVSVVASTSANGDMPSFSHVFIVLEAGVVRVDVCCVTYTFISGARKAFTSNDAKLESSSSINAGCVIIFEEKKRGPL